MSAQKTQRMNGQRIFLLILAGLFVYLLFRTLSYSWLAALMPGLVIATILALVTALLVQDFFVAKRKATDGTGKNQGRGASENEIASLASHRKRALEIVAWICLLIILVFLGGFMVVIPIWLFLFLRVRFSVGWLTSAAVIGGLEVLLYLTFVVFLKVMLYGGLLGVLLAPD